MWAVILLILKIIGITLLSILGLLIVLILVVLFVPVRYKIKAKREGTEDAKPVEAMAKVTWLLHIVSVSAVYPAEEILKVRLFGIKLKMKGGKKEAEAKTDRPAEVGTKPVESADNTETVNMVEPADNTEPVNTVEPVDNAEPDSATEPAEPAGPFEEPTEITERPEPSGMSENAETAEASDTAEPTGPSEILSEPGENEDESEDEPSIGGFIRWLEKISYTIRSAYDKMINKRQDARDRSAERKAKADEIIQVIIGEPFQNALHTCLYQLGRILKHIAPQKMLIRCEIGLDDPYTTGRILGIYGMLYPWIWKQVKVVGNFEEEVIRGDAFIRGRIRLISLVVAAAKIYFNKDVKKMIRLFRKKGGK